MSFYVLIADDEYFIRQRIKKIIPWETLDLHFVGEAANGLEVIDLLSQHPMDIVILDIKMPKLTGLQVSEYIFQNYPMTQIIILSGYNDFDYVRSTFRFGITDYLLKPVETSALTNALIESCKRIEYTKQQHLEKQKYTHYQKCSLFSNVLSEHLSLEDLLLQYPTIKNTPYCLYIGVFLDSSTNDVPQSFISCLDNYSIDYAYFKESEYIFVFQIFLATNKIPIFLQNLLNEWLIKSKSFIFFSVSNIFDIKAHWLSYYKQVLCGLNQRYFASSSDLYFISDTLISDYSCDNLFKIRDKIVFLLNSKDTTAFENYIEALFQQICEHQNYTFMYTLLTEIFITYSIYFGKIIKFNNNVPEFISELIEEEYRLEYLKTQVITFGLQGIHQNKTIPSEITLSRKIIHYVHKNYALSTLSVNQISEVFQLNASYMNSIFKKVNQHSIIQHITSIRMENAKKLIQSHQYKISDIAEMVGYSDVFYFSKRFKKMYGYSPKEYANQLKI